MIDMWWRSGGGVWHGWGLLCESRGTDSNKLTVGVSVSVGVGVGVGIAI
jgi:hypothetical protein